ncbi:phospholipid-binding protein MlaC [Balneola sp. MJW-20]|uniref:MlaC/ttg2D family ABC transporter substrate-binding protein n=1 Tax=Gracilimonas aurantiaca TaxID=3234185 RepID=UPI0034672927
MKRFTTAFLFLGLIISTAIQVQAQKSEADVKNLLEQRDQEIKDLLGPEGTEYTDDQRAKLKNIINGIIDFEAMAKVALEGTFDTLSDENRAEFVDLFSTIIRDQSLNKLDIYRADVDYELINVNGDDARVETIAELDEIRTPVYYDMYYKGSEWVITDMSIDDVSTANSYQKQFTRIINKRGFDGLMDVLRKRAARATSTSSE